jgi:hypothetical protein
MSIISAFKASRGGTGIAPNLNHQGGGGSHLAYTQFQADGHHAHLWWCGKAFGI